MLCWAQFVESFPWMLYGKLKKEREVICVASAEGREGFLGVTSWIDTLTLTATATALDT